MALGAAGSLLDAIAAGQGLGVMSALAVAEVVSGPARFDDHALALRFADELSSLEGVAVVPVDGQVSLEAALIRGRGPLTLADAIHLATARLANASALVTNDQRIESIRGVEAVPLSDLVHQHGSDAATLPGR